MKVKREELQKALEIVKPGLASKEIIEQTSDFAFLNGRIITYNDAISISTPVKGIDIEGAVPAEELYRFVTQATTDEISIEIKDQLLLRSGKAKAGLVLVLEIKLPLAELGEEHWDWKPIPKRFLTALKMCHLTCARDMAEPVLTTVHIAKNGVMQGCDGYRALQFDLKEVMPVNTFLLPATSAATVVNLDVKEISTSPGWMHFRDENDTILSCRIFADNYRNITGVLDIEGAIPLKLPKDLDGIVERAKIFAKKEVTLDEEVTVDVQEKRLFIKAKSTHGWFEEWVKMEAEVERPFNFQIHPALLLEAVGKLDECMVLKGIKIGLVTNEWKFVVALRGSE